MKNLDRILTKDNIDQIAEGITERLQGKMFAIASVMRVESENSSLELVTDCRFESSWTDGSKEPVRVFDHSPERRWLGFSAGHYFWTFDTADKDSRYPHFSFNHDGFIVALRAPCGDLHKHIFKVQQEQEMES